MEERGEIAEIFQRTTGKFISQDELEKLVNQIDEKVLVLKSRLADINRIKRKISRLEGKIRRLRNHMVINRYDAKEVQGDREEIQKCNSQIAQLEPLIKSDNYVKSELAAADRFYRAHHAGIIEKLKKEYNGFRNELKALDEKISECNEILEFGTQSHSQKYCDDTAKKLSEYKRMREEIETNMGAIAYEAENLEKQQRILIYGKSKRK